MARYLNKAQKLKRSSLLYQKVKRAVIKELKKQNLEYTPQEVTELVRKIYPTFKGFNARDVRVHLIREATANVVTADESIYGLEYYNPSTIPIDKLTAIEWWGIDEHLSVDLTSLIFPKNIRFEVNAGIEYGTTGIIDMYYPNGGLKYEYNLSGLHQIVENIRIAENNGSGPEWVGEARVRKGFKNDGKPNSYFIQYTLYLPDGTQVQPTESFEEATPELTGLSLDEQRKRLGETISKRKELEKQRREAQKQKDIRKRKRPTTKEKIEKPSSTGKGKTTPITSAPSSTEKEQRVQNIQTALDRQERLLSEARRDFDDKILNKKEYKERVKSIMDQTSKAISKFDSGGIV